MDENKQVYCTDCKHLKLLKVFKDKDDFIPSCPFEYDCDIFDCEDSRKFKERPHYEAKIKNL